MSGSDLRKFLIVGCGRSGTTMLQQLLNRHSRIAIPPETGFFTDVLGHPLRGQLRHLRQIERDLGIELTTPRRRLAGDEAIRFFDRLADLYVQRLGRPEVTHFGDKSPRHLLALPRIEKLLPDIPVVLVYRDGRDVALSLSEVPWSPGDVDVNFAIWLRYCRWHDRAVRRSSLPVLEVRYEDLVRDPRTGLAAVLDFLELPAEPLLDRPPPAADGIAPREMAWKARALEPIDTSRVERWRDEMDARQLGRLESRGGETLRSLGYELAAEPRRPSLLDLIRVHCRWGLWRLARGARLVARDLLGI